MHRHVMRLLLTALLLFGAMPLSYGNVPPSSIAGLGEAGTAVARGVGHAVTTEAVYGGKFENVLKRSLVSEASAAGFEFIGHHLYDNPKYKTTTLPPKAVVHGLVGGVMAQISGGDFTSGAIATATAHVIGEDLIGPRYADQVIKGEMSSARAKQQIDAIASAVAGAVTVMAHGGKMSDKDLSASMAVAHSVVENNYLKGWDAYVKFGQGIVKGGKEKAWDDLKAAGLALASPRQTIEAIGALLSSPEAMKGMAKETYNELVRQYKHVSDALYSDKAYEGDAAKLAGKDAGKLTLALVEAYGGVKGLTVVAKGVGKAARKGFAKMRQVDVAKSARFAAKAASKARDLIAGGKKADVVKLPDLSKVSPPKGKTFEGTVHRYENPDRIDGTWKQNEYNVDADHRYTGEGQGGVYAGTTQETALKEVTQGNRPLRNKIPIQKKVRLNNVLDLTDPKVRKQIGVTKKDITSTDLKTKYIKTHKIGEWAKKHGYDGILAPSARNLGGSNIVILKGE